MGRRGHRLFDGGGRHQKEVNTSTGQWRVRLEPVLGDYGNCAQKS